MAAAFGRMKDLDLANWAARFGAWMAGESARPFVSEADAAAFAAAAQAYHAQLKIALAPATRTTLAVAEKRVMREELLTVSRRLVKQVSSNVACTDLLREELELGVRAERRKAIPVPAERPRVTILGAVAPTIDLRIHDSASLRSMGRDVAAAECYVYIGNTPPATLDGWSFAGTTTRSRMKLTVGNASGQTVWITCRFVNARAQPGPTSDPCYVNLPVFGVQLGGVLTTRAA